MPILPERDRDARPERGPRILFFSGGTALRPLCRALKLRTHNSVHVVTPFDSGGSSGPLRRAFGMPAVGDLRNRMLALADEEAPGSAQRYRLFSYRLPGHGPAAPLWRTLDALAAGDDPLVAGVGPAARRYAQARLRAFARAAPAGFDLRGASIGNLTLTGAWLSTRDLAAAVREFSDLLSVRGTVHAAANADVHLAVRLADGRRIVGQHRITGKEAPPLSSPIRELWLVDNETAARRVEIDAPAAVLAVIRRADLICFPMGSFFSSVLCNLLPAGVGRAIAEAPCKKVYVPNTGDDPEQRGLDAAAAARLLVETLRRDAGADVETSLLLDRVLLDPGRLGERHADAGREPPARGDEAREIARLGIAPITTPLCDPGATEIAPTRLADRLMALATEQVRASRPHRAGRSS